MGLTTRLSNAKGRSTPRQQPKPVLDAGRAASGQPLVPKTVRAFNVSKAYSDAPSHIINNVANVLQRLPNVQYKQELPSADTQWALRGVARVPQKKTANAPADSTAAPRELDFEVRLIRQIRDDKECHLIRVKRHDGNARDFKALCFTLLSNVSTKLTTAR
jgi:hypothetical protein